MSIPIDVGISGSGAWNIASGAPVNIDAGIVFGPSYGAPVNNSQNQQQDPSSTATTALPGGSAAGTSGYGSAANGATSGRATAAVTPGTASPTYLWLALAAVAGLGAWWFFVRKKG